MFRSHTATTPYIFPIDTPYHQRGFQHDCGARIPPTQYQRRTNYKNQFDRKPFANNASYTHFFDPALDMLPDDSMPFLSPPQRTFEELHAERSYLLKILQNEDIKSTDLLRRLSDLEERLLYTELYNRRNTHKNLNFVKSRLRQSKRQEKAILARLGDVTLDIQMQERWTQIANERREQELILSQQPMFCQSPTLYANSIDPSAFPGMYEPQQQFGFAWPPPVQYYPESPDFIYNPAQRWQTPYYEPPSGEESNWTGSIGDSQDNTLPTPVGRSQSLTNIWSDLTYAATNTPCYAVPVWKRHSIPKHLESFTWTSRRSSNVDNVEMDDARVRLMGYHIGV